MRSRRRENRVFPYARTSEQRVYAITPPADKRGRRCASIFRVGNDDRHRKTTLSSSSHYYYHAVCRSVVRLRLPKRWRWSVATRSNIRSIIMASIRRWNENRFRDEATNVIRRKIFKILWFEFTANRTNRVIRYTGRGSANFFFTRGPHKISKDLNRTKSVLNTRI